MTIKWCEYVVISTSHAHKGRNVAPTASHIYRLVGSISCLEGCRTPSQANMSESNSTHGKQGYTNEIKKPKKSFINYSRHTLWGIDHKNRKLRAAVPTRTPDTPTAGPPPVSVSAKASKSSARDTKTARFREALLRRAIYPHRPTGGSRLCVHASSAMRQRLALLEVELVRVGIVAQVDGVRR
jgi:hypothetical protein